MNFSDNQKKDLRFVKSTKILGDFIEYRNTVLELVKVSQHNFSVGIYGEWGSGKTTLMKSIYEELELEPNKNNIIIPIWFNAWQYEHEEHLALFPLLKTITEGIDKGIIKIKDINPETVNNLKKTIKAVLKGIVKSTPALLPLFLPVSSSDKVKEFAGTVSENFKDEISKLTDAVNDTMIDHTTYASGLKSIEDAMKEISNNEINNEKVNLKFVVFVDDTDRCSPKKALQVLESIKIFLDIEGFIFIVGISYHKLLELIEIYYKGYSYDSKEYLNKIIQVPIFLPMWDTNLIKDLISNLTENLDDTYRKYIEENKDLIVSITEKNPRKTVTIINNLIFMYKLYEPVIERAVEKIPPIINDKKKVIPLQFIILQIMSLFWNDFYQLILNVDKYNADIFLDEIKQYTSGKVIYGLKLKFISLQSYSSKKEFRKIIIKYKNDEKFKRFLDDNQKILNDIFSPNGLSDEDYNKYLDIFRQKIKLTSIKLNAENTTEEPKNSNTNEKTKSKSSRLKRFREWISRKKEA
jgi:hypothetical protein